MNKVGMFYTYWSTEWMVDFPATAKRIAGLGFDMMEISLGEFHNLPDAQKRELKAVADDLGLTVMCCIGLKPEYDFASPEQSVRDAGTEYVKRLLDDCHMLGAPVFAGLTFCAWPQSPPPGMKDKRPYVDHAIDSVRRVIGIAEDYGIIYALEVVNRFEQWLCNDAKEALAFVDAVDSPACKVQLDTFHMNIEEHSFRDAILACKGKLGHFHLGEANRLPPGEGRLPWDEIFGALKEIDYDGTIVMEPFMRKGGSVSRAVGVWRDMSNGATDEQMDERARRSLQFVRGKLA
ncbi:sugar phosphate isomerase/epimerase [Caballeronia novacaledonica]|uniref:D-psicose 3-epimerase n=1 Tax=Caballeronia novacaledonica TaxID=1544861 RepID=UPI001EE2E0D8|nr:sugar phosphate isomerase/epimerase family protein [Caballeronia novacaledonica]GJH09551.1 sugar phosphate isomerase/epimerase [Caballeronia novacaledonica]